MAEKQNPERSAPSNGKLLAVLWFIVMVVIVTVTITLVATTGSSQGWFLAIFGWAVIGFLTLISYGLGYTQAEADWKRKIQKDAEARRG